MSDKRKRNSSPAGGTRREGSRLSPEQRRTEEEKANAGEDVKKNSGQDKSKEQEFRYTRSMYGPSGRVPPVDAFDHVPRRMPPPHVREQLLREAEIQKAREEAAAKSKLKKKKRRKSKKAPPQAGKRTRQAAPAPDAVRQQQYSDYDRNGSLPPGEEAAQNTSKRKRRTKKRKKIVPQKLRRRRRILSAFLVLILAAGGIIFSFRMLFKIESFKLVGESPYSKQQIMQFFSPQAGDNLFGFSKKTAELRIETSLPYISNVKISRVLPNTVVFTVTQAKEKYYMPWNNSYAILSDEMKVLKFSEDEPAALVGIFGLPDIAEPAEIDEPAPYTDDDGAFQPEGEGNGGGSAPEDGAEAAPEPTPSPEPTPTPTPEPGTKPGESPVPEESVDPAQQMKVAVGYSLDSDDDLAFMYMDMLLKALSKSVLWEDLTWIDIKDPLSIQFRWQDRITIFVGSQTGIEDKVDIARTILTDEVEDAVSADARGTLDVSTYPETLKVSYWDD